MLSIEKTAEKVIALLLDDRPEMALTLLAKVEIDNLNSKRRKILKELYLEALLGSGDIESRFYNLLKTFIDKWTVAELKQIVLYITYMNEVLINSSYILNEINLKIDWKTVRRKKDLLIKMTSLSHQYYDSSLALLMDNNTVAAKSLVRSILEIGVNTKFIYLTRDNSNLKRLIVHEIEYASGALKAYIGTLPNKSKQKKSHESTLRKMSEKIKRQGVKKAPGLLGRSKDIDNYHNINEYVASYTWVYSIYSAQVHGTSYALDNLIKGFGISAVGELNDFGAIVFVATDYHLKTVELLSKKVKYTSKYLDEMRAAYSKIQMLIETELNI